MVMKHILLAALAAVMLGGCATARVSTDFDSAADFGRYKTWAFVEGRDTGREQILADPEVRAIVEKMIRTQLVGRGLSEVAASAKPDLAVRYSVGVEHKHSEVIGTGPATLGRGAYGPLTVRGGDPLGGYDAFSAGRWGPFYEQKIAFDFREGTLIVDLIDPGKKDLVWRAVVAGTLQNKREDSVRIATEGLAQAFANYPPKR